MSLEPSRVIYVRNVSESSKEQLMKFLSQFGTVTNTAWLHNLDKALVEFEMLESAENLIRFCQTSGTPITIDGKPATFAFSKSQKINTPSSQKSYVPSGSQRILHCNIQDPWYNITVEVIQSIMDRFGKIQRIVIFTKSTLQVLVEFESPESARAALEALDGKDIYPDCCKLKIEFSRQERLNVHYNNSKQCDFTVSLPRGPEDPSVMPQMNPAVDMQQWQSRQFMPAQFFPGMTGMMQMPMAGPSQPDVHAGMQPTQMYPAQQYGQYRQPQQIRPHPAPTSVPAPAEVPVVMVSQLPPRIKEQHIFNFASLYGIVEKVKNLGQGRMLCQMRSPAEAKQLIEALNTVTIIRNHVRAEASYHASIRDGSGESSMDFSTSPFNRYKDGTKPLLPSKTIAFTVHCSCTLADITAALKASSSPEASDIVLDEKKEGESSGADANESSTEGISTPKTPDEDSSATTTEVTTGKISCASTGTAAEIVMMANNTLMCGGLAPLELSFDS